MHGPLVLFLALTPTVRDRQFLAKLGIAADRIETLRHDHVRNLTGFSSVTVHSS
jgi:hypothetical protein